MKEKSCIWKFIHKKYPQFIVKYFLLPIFQVDDVDMRELNHFEAVSVLRETGETVTIRAYRPGLVTERERVDVENHSLNQTFPINTQEDVRISFTFLW